MNYLEHRFALDIRRGTSPVSVTVRRSDTAQRLCITLTNGIIPYVISEECYAMFSGMKPDGNALLNPCTIEDNRIIYELTAQTTAVEGVVNCEIRLYGADDMLITSPGFDLVVENTVYNEENVPQSEAEVEALTKLISDAAEVIEEGEQLIGDYKGALEKVEGIRDEAVEAAEAAQKVVDDLKNGNVDISASCPVQSVNGKKGAVALDAEDVGADPTGTAEKAVSGHNTDTTAHNDLRVELKALAERVNTILDSDDVTLDQMSEIVAYRDFVPDIPEHHWTSRGYVCIDGQHRIERARQLGIKTLPVVVIRMEQHIPFLYEGYDRYVKYWNGKLKDRTEDALRWQRGTTQ